jgi:hypothetical protein
LFFLGLVDVLCFEFLLERIAKSRGIPVIEPFSGVTDSTGRVIVAGPSEKFYESLLPAFRGTPEPKASLGLMGKAFEAGKDAITWIAERWYFETLTDDGEISPENNSSAIVLVKGEVDEFMLFTGDAGMPALTEASDYLSSRGFDFAKLRFIQVPHHGS